MKFRHLAAVCLCTAVLVVLGAACGGTSTSSSSTSSTSGQHGFEVAHFANGAISGDVSTADCTLSGGSASTCATFTISGTPSTYSAGPFCPDTVTTPADEAGIWFDGNGVYDLTGSFIKNLSTFYNDSEWLMYDEQGNVNVTDTQEAFLGAARPDVDPQYQNYCVEGRVEWLTNGAPITKTVVIPTTPVLAKTSSAANGQDWGITLDGIVIAKSAPVSAILGAHTIASFDDCGGHFNNVEGYHMHGVTGCGTLDDDHIAGETAMFGYAMDGFPIHLPLTGDDLAAANLDECGGHSTPELGYHYHANDPSKNSVLTCLKGELATTSDAQGGGPGNGQGPPGGGAPDLTATASTLGVTVHELENALGQAPNGDLNAAATILGVSAAELEAAMPQRPAGANGAPPTN
ncbi:MAG: YHYH protein [Actinobacteria bacterium]|nr:YHYH protein [Actinomycetota bacterium]